MRGRKPKLTPELQDQIVAYVGAGAFSLQAAKAAGVPKSTYYRWMQQGERARSGAYRAFYEAIEAAGARARVSAEVEVRRANPLAWLRYGPGRQRPDEPGWTETHELNGPESGPMRVTFNIKAASGGIELPRDREGEGAWELADE